MYIPAAGGICLLLLEIVELSKPRELGFLDYGSLGRLPYSRAEFLGRKW